MNPLTYPKLYTFLPNIPFYGELNQKILLVFKDYTLLETDTVESHILTVGLNVKKNISQEGKYHYKATGLSFLHQRIDQGVGKEELFHLTLIERGLPPPWSTIILQCDCASMSAGNTGQNVVEIYQVRGAETGCEVPSRRRIKAEIGPLCHIVVGGQATRVSGVGYLVKL